MSRLTGADMTGREQVSIHIGGVVASRCPTIIRTVLGSCISVCLHDPLTQIGGMNHFMLPNCDHDETGSARYGIHAMELLINGCMGEGADRRRIQAKVFGGGHVMKVRETDGNVPQSNIAFALNFLETERIPIVSQDLGGYAARELYFFTDSGRILMRRLLATGTADEADMQRLERQEREQMRRPAAPPANDDNVTLF